MNYIKDIERINRKLKHIYCPQCNSDDVVQQDGKSVFPSNPLWFLFKIF
jgi:transposase-like protein